MAVTRYCQLYSLAILSLLSISVNATVLPEDRVDVLYHKYDGGGITIDGPSVLVRKSFADQVSVSANYYVDNITSASIDAVTQASEYTENRVQQQVGVDYLHEKSIINYSFTTSVENDYDATTHAFGISQEMFGGLTTLSLGYNVGDNIVTATGNTAFKDTSTFKNYRTSLAQVLTKDLILSLTYDIITDEGFLNNPYRQIRYVDGASYSFDFERYPRTRTSNAVSFSLRYYLPYRAAVFGGYRYFTDSWEIRSDTFEFGYIHPLEENWKFEATFRYYSQDQAVFYNDLFDDNSQNFVARDKELSTFTDTSIGIGVTYEFDDVPLFERGTANFFYTYMSFDYANFRDIRVNTPTPGDEPLYSFTAGITRLYFSFWF